MNQLIHTFLHPVIKFSGNAELLQQTAEILQNTMNVKVPADAGDPQKISRELMRRLTKIKNRIPVPRGKHLSYEEQKGFRRKGKLDALTAQTLRDKFENIINIFKHSLDVEENSNILSRAAIRDTSLLVMEELTRFKYFESGIGEDSRFEIGH